MIGQAAAMPAPRRWKKPPMPPSASALLKPSTKTPMTCMKIRRARSKTAMTVSMAPETMFRKVSDWR